MPDLMLLVRAPMVLARDLGRYAQSVLVRARWAGRGVAIDTRVTLTVTGQAQMSLGRGVVVRRGAILIASDEKADGVACSLTVGERTAINESANIRAAGGEIRIGADTLISQFVTVVASNYAIESLDKGDAWRWQASGAGVTIGDRVWIGAGTIVLPGVHIGHDAIIGAGSVVTRNVPAAEIWAGNPARCLRSRGR